MLRSKHNVSTPQGPAAWVAYPLLRVDIPESKGEIMGDPTNSAVTVERGGVALIERFYYYVYGGGFLHLDPFRKQL